MYFGIYLVILLRKHAVLRDGGNVSHALLSAASFYYQEVVLEETSGNNFAVVTSSLNNYLKLVCM